MNGYMKDEDSMFRLLGDLSAFVKARRIALREELRPGPREGSREEPADERIFDEAMKDIRKIEAGKQRVGQVPQQKITIEEDSEEKKLAETLSDQYRFNVTNLPEYMEGYVEGTHPVTMEKLRSGEYSVQKVLDLHGLRVDEAYELFQEFIKDSTHANIRCVKVIHGRGLKSRNGPVLKEKLKEWIVRAMHRRWVVAFVSANMRDGGPGATNIILRQQPRKQRLHIIG
jgi:DNA-nicking Smr family endonuclease